jgi:Septum formation
VTGRWTSVTVALLLGVVLGGAAACSQDQPATAKRSSTPTTTTSTSTATPTAPPPATPPRHACYDLDLAAAAAPTSAAQPVPCSGRHTTATFHVGTIHPVVDGHLLAVDSDTVQQQVASRCRSRFASYVGGGEETRRLSRLTVVWFTPSLSDSDRGALWFRCDLVALAGRDQLAELPRATRDVLGAPQALDRFGTCGTSSPAARAFERVICSARHTWRARATVAVPPGAKYLGKAADAAASSSCHDIEARLASDALKLKWSFEWPTREQWRAGQRFGYCWTPDPA